MCRLTRLAFPGLTGPAAPAAPAVQLLGMKGADMETDIWKIRVQLMKPVTWIPLIWGEQSDL